MRALAVCALFLAVVCTLGQAASVNDQTLARQKRQTETATTTGTDILANTKKLIEDLAANLCQAAKQAVAAMTSFASGLKDQVRIMREKLEAEIQKLRDRVSQAIANVGDRLSNAGGAVKECIESHKKKADELLNNAVYRTMTCADGRVQEVSELISRQVEISQGGIEFANRAIDEMKNCTQNNNIFTKGACLGAVALKTEMKGAFFMTQSGISIARIDIALAKLPIGLEMCAGQRLLEAGMGTAKIIVDLNRCKASNTFSALTGLTGSSPSTVSALTGFNPSTVSALTGSNQSTVSALTGSNQSTVSALTGSNTSTAPNVPVPVGVDISVANNGPIVIPETTTE